MVFISGGLSLCFVLPSCKFAGYIVIFVIFFLIISTFSILNGIACNIAENQSKPTWQAIFYIESLVFKLEIQYNDCWMGLQLYTSWLISYWLAEIFLTCHQVGTNIFHLKNWPVFPGTSHYGLGNFGPFFWQFRPVQTQVFSSFLLD